MDGLSGAASVIAILQLTQSVGEVLKNYYEGVRDARDEIRRLYDSVRSLEATLTQLQYILDKDATSTLLSPSLSDSSSALKLSELELKNLKSALESGSNATRFGNAFRSLAWPFKKKEVASIVGNLDRHRSTLLLSLGVETL